MKNDRTVQHCQWAESTVFLPMPIWLDAWDFPWSCRTGGEPRLIRDTEECRMCPRWTPREEEGASPPENSPKRS